MKLLVLDNGQIVHSLSVPVGPLTIGRAPGNTLVLQRTAISSHHALLVRDGDRLHVRDLGSTNGLFIGNVRTTDGYLGPDDTLRIGDLELRIQCGAASDEPSPTALRIQQSNGPVAWDLLSGFSHPAHPEAVLHHDETGVWMDHAGTTRPLSLDTDFELAGQSYRIVQAPLLAATIPLAGVFPYHVDVDLTAERATVTSATMEPAVVRAPHRVSLLFVLASHRAAWVDDAEVGVAVWGRSWSRHDPNNLNVLVHRVRHEVARAGFDKRFIERRRGGLRLVVESAVSR